MAKKTLLNEAQVRRFMGLAGMKADIVSNHLKEMNMSTPSVPSMKRDDKEEEMEEGMGMYKRDEEEMEEAAYKRDEKEMEEAAYYEQEEDPADDEMKMDEPAMDMGEPEAAASEIPEEMREKVFMAAAQALANELDVDASFDDVDADDDEPEEPAMDMDEPVEDDMAADEPAEEVMEQALSDVNLQLSEEEIVQEVAKRVTQRILKAKRAQRELNEALGKK